MNNAAHECSMSDQDKDEVRITRIESPSLSSVPQKSPVQLHTWPAVPSSSTAPAVTVVQGPVVRRTVITGSPMQGPPFSRTPTPTSPVQRISPSASLLPATLHKPTLSASATHQQMASASSGQAKSVIISHAVDPNHQYMPPYLSPQHHIIEPALQMRSQGQTASGMSSLGMPHDSDASLTSQMLQQAKPGSPKTYRILQNVGGSKSVVVLSDPVPQSLQKAGAEPNSHTKVQPRQMPIPPSPNVALDHFRFLHPVVPPPKVLPTSAQQHHHYKQPQQASDSVVAPLGGQRKRPMPMVLFEPQYTKRARFYTVVTQGGTPQPPTCCSNAVSSSGVPLTTMDSSHRSQLQLSRGLPSHTAVRPTTMPLAAQGQMSRMQATMSPYQ